MCTPDQPNIADGPFGRGRVGGDRKSRRGRAVLESLYAGMVVEPAPTYKVAVSVDCDSAKTKKRRFEKMILLKRGGRPTGRRGRTRRWPTASPVSPFDVILGHAVVTFPAAFSRENRTVRSQGLFANAPRTSSPIQSRGAPRSFEAVYAGEAPRRSRCHSVGLDEAARRLANGRAQDGQRSPIVVAHDAPDFYARSRSSLSPSEVSQPVVVTRSAASWALWAPFLFFSFSPISERLDAPEECCPPRAATRVDGASVPTSASDARRSVPSLYSKKGRISSLPRVFRKGCRLFLVRSGRDRFQRRRAAPAAPPTTRLPYKARRPDGSLRKRPPTQSPREPQAPGARRTSNHGRRGDPLRGQDHRPRRH